jgi:sulfate adenylyltransferase
MSIQPHGGQLVNRTAEGKERESLSQATADMPAVALNPREQCDLLMIATGAMSPLEGFMGRDDYQSVLDLKRLANGLPWTLPVTLAVDGKTAARLAVGGDVALHGTDGAVLGVLHLREMYPVDKAAEAEKVLLTTDERHPGVHYLKGIGDVYLGGRITLLQRPPDGPLVNFLLDPRETRLLFKLRGWHSVVAFQTRNPIHRAHEYILKCALESVDGLLIHPLVGETKADDIPADVRMRCYDALLRDYFPKTRTVISVFPAAMRYAGPREAVFHALVRKNYGCTHLIVGRDHAGVGNFYGPFDAHYIFREFEPEEIAIQPMFFDNTFFCRSCQQMASAKTCPHDSAHHLTLSGTRLREMLAAGEYPPAELSRPEVAAILIEHTRGRGDGA